MIIDHRHDLYHQKWARIGINRFNGAYYYSQEIVKNIIPSVETDRNWMTINIPGLGMNHSIVFVHNNLHPEHYDWLRQYRDLVIVCGVPETVEKMSHLGKAIYLPLSIDVEEVKQYCCEKTKNAAFAGRPAKRRDIELPEDVDILEGMPREVLLAEMAKYKTIYAVGRTALEAKALGCRLKAYDPRYPKTSLWKVMDNKQAAKKLQKMLDEIDGQTGMEKEDKASM